MANNIVTHDPARRALAIKSNQLIATRHRLIEFDSPQGGLAPTVFLVRKRGGVGSSTLLPILEYVIDRPSIFIEVGGIRSAIFANLPAGKHIHFKSGDPDRVAHAIDRRMEFPEKLALLDFEPVLFKQAIDAAVTLTEEFEASVGLFYIAARDEIAPKFRERAMSLGVRQVVMLGQVAIETENRPDVIRIPSLPKEVLEKLQRGSSDLTTLLNALTGEFTKVRTAKKLEDFAQALVEAMAR